MISKRGSVGRRGPKFQVSRLANIKKKKKNQKQGRGKKWRDGSIVQVLAVRA